MKIFSYRSKKKLARFRNRTSNTGAERLWYIHDLFEYNNRLLERIENRANFLLISNSFIAASYFSLLSFLLEQTKFFRENDQQNAIPVAYNFFDFLSVGAVILPGLLLLLSVLFSVRTILPIILRTDIKLNQAFIAAMEPTEYINFYRSRSTVDLEDDFIEEIHILSQITEVKSARVNLAAISFVVAVCSIPPVVILFLVSLFT